MAYVFTDPRIGLPRIGTPSTTAGCAVGTIARAEDPTYGGGEFIYLKGVVSTVLGSAVIFDQNAVTTTLATAGSRGPVAVAMSANVASNYDWYQIGGLGVIKAATVAANTKVYATSTAGQVDDAVVSGDQITGMDFKTADGTPAAGQAVVQMDRPAMDGTG